MNSALPLPRRLPCRRQAQDVGAGETSFGKCRSCHAVGADAKNSIGPQLNGIDGSKYGSVEGYRYSAANKNCGFRWAESVFLECIRDPKLKIQGTKKSTSGIRDEAEARDLWTYLSRIGPDGQLKPATARGRSDQRTI